MKRRHRSKNSKSERGNVFLFVLIGVIMFAALSFTVSRSMRSNITSSMSERELDLAASDILEYSASIGRAVNLLRRRGASEDELSFENDTIGGYANGNCADNTCKVFYPSGGAISFRSAKALVPALTSDFRFNGSNRFETFGCTATTTACSELVVELNLNEEPELCLKINELMGITNPSSDAPRLNNWLDGSIFTGTFEAATANLVGGSNAVNDAPELKGKMAGCLFEFSGGQNIYRFYRILLVR